MKLHYACGKLTLLGKHFGVVLFQELFGIHGGHAAGAGGGNRLAITMVLNVPSDKYTRNLCLAAIQGDEISVRIHLKLAAENHRVGVVTDSNENALELEIRGRIGFRVT